MFHITFYFKTERYMSDKNKNCKASDISSFFITDLPIS